MDWPKLIAELGEARLTQADIAKRCGCAQPTISDLARGVIAEPKHSLGQALIALHDEMGKAAA